MRVAANIVSNDGDDEELVLLAHQMEPVVSGDIE